jgi:Tfp pilus assembly protein PilN
MLRHNLSTRPFYNERIVHLALGLAGAVVLLLTAYNAIRIVALSRQNTEFSTLIDRDRGEAQRLTADARRIRAGIDQDQLRATAQAAESANRLIDQRTFSGTEFFNRIEDTLPPDVMLTSVRPTFDEDRSIINMTVLARRTEDIDEFIEKLEATGAFRNVLLPQVDRTDEGMNKASLRADYAAAPPAAEPSGAGPAVAPPGAAPGRGAAQ